MGGFQKSIEPFLILRYHDYGKELKSVKKQHVAELLQRERKTGS